MGTKYTKKIILENGKEFYGFSFGADIDAVCELVFNTAVVGYQEIITDPSYMGQAVVLTYPLIGNYGITAEDNETRTPTIAGIITREYNDLPSNFRYTRTLSETLVENNIVGIAGVDTRAITRMLRDKGTMRCIITSVDTPVEEGIKIIKETPVIRDSVKRVSCKKRWYSRTADFKYNVVAIDCGIKNRLIRILNKMGCNLTIVPYDITAEELMALRPDGVVISDGPGNPEDVPEVIATIKAVLGKLNIMGIGLGNQIICLALGGKTQKLKHGHIGINHPVRNLVTGKIEITSQNHSYGIDAESLKDLPVEILYKSILDDTVEGLATKDGKALCVQFNAEGAPGPEDSGYIFDKFKEMMEKGGNK